MDLVDRLLIQQDLLGVLSARHVVLKNLRGLSKTAHPGAPAARAATGCRASVTTSAHRQADTDHTVTGSLRGRPTSIRCRCGSRTTRWSGSSS